MEATKLVIVKRAKVMTFHRLQEKFAGRFGVQVALDRRIQPQDARSQVSRERRHLQKDSDRDYVVVYSAAEHPGLLDPDTVDDCGNTPLTDVVHNWSWWRR